MPVLMISISHLKNPKSYYSMGRDFDKNPSSLMGFFFNLMAINDWGYEESDFEKNAYVF